VALALPAAAVADTGGTSSEPVPAVTAVTCRTGCSGAYARTGSVVALKGKSLADVVAVAFTGGPPVRPQRASEKQLLVVVPKDAATGAVVVADSSGQASAPSPPAKIREVAVPERNRGPLATVVTGRKAFVDGELAPTLTYRLDAGRAADVVVSVVRRRDNRVVKTFDQGSVAPGETREVPWRGRAEGRYAFVASTAGERVRATTAQTDSDTFALFAHKFPIPGTHDYGTGGGARFGAGRSGHSHQGQDVFAQCGTPLVAARGGVVKINRYQGNAGNYLVIDGAGTAVDHMYAHLRDPALLAKGERVRTGQLLGYVGDTGDAHGCHLHFEAWAGPGWYTGGKPFDPLPDLRAWDAYS